MPRKRSAHIDDFIVDNVFSHPRDISRLTADQLKLSRNAVAKHLQNLVANGILEAVGKTKGREYRLVQSVHEEWTFEITPQVAEHEIWREKMLPLLSGVKDNVLGICNHGFTEMVNNVIDHSESPTMSIVLIRDAADIGMDVIDRGIGIFTKIQKDFGLSDPRDALFELNKGKLTSDQSKHSGEGIFFTSRMFDKFLLSSGRLNFCRLNKKDDWLIDVQDIEEVLGTKVTMLISCRATQTALEVFDKYSPERDKFGFSRTHVPLQLLKYEGEQLVSRSQAKRLLARADQFTEVLLDFRGIKMIGQAFADEVFRVFANARPDISIQPLNAEPQVQRMIRRVSSSKLEGGNVGPAVKGGQGRIEGVS